MAYFLYLVKVNHYSKSRKTRGTMEEKGVPKGRRDEIQAAAEAAGQSVNAYIVEAVDRRIQGHECPNPPEDN